MHANVCDLWLLEPVHVHYLTEMDPINNIDLVSMRNIKMLDEELNIHQLWSAPAIEETYLKLTVTNLGYKIMMDNSKTLKENSNEENKPPSSKSFLPPKKRFGQYTEYHNTEESTKTKVEKKTPIILPGVIRHTSCPDHSLAYFIN